MAVSTLNVQGLDQLIKALENVPIAKVGVLGDHNSRKDGEKTNAEIGAKHEYGEDGMPIRSFLRMPLTNELQKFLESSGLFTKDLIARVVKEGSLDSLIECIGISGVNTVLEAFKTGGFGAWKPSEMKYKKVHQTLVETQQLRNSITYEVTER